MELKGKTKHFFITDPKRVKSSSSKRQVISVSLKNAILKNYPQLTDKQREQLLLFDVLPPVYIKYLKSKRKI